MNAPEEPPEQHTQTESKQFVYQRDVSAEMAPVKKQLSYQRGVVTEMAPVKKQLVYQRDVAASGLPATGVDVDAHQFSFKLSTTALGADGFSFNFGNDVATSSASAEQGSGTKLSVCFDDADDVLLVIPDAVKKFVFIGVLEGYEVGVKILLGILVLVNVTVLVDVLDMVDVDVGTTLFIKRFLSLFIKLIDNKKIKNFNITYC
jgi:hypothetical protein